MDANELVERVGKAICRERGVCSPHPCDVSPDGGCIPSKCYGGTVYRSEARAALREIVAAAGGVDAVKHTAEYVCRAVNDRRQFERANAELVSRFAVANTDRLASTEALLRALAEGGKDA